MAENRVNRVFRIRKPLLEAFDRLPVTRSAAIALALLGLQKAPESVIVRGVQRRLRADDISDTNGDTSQVCLSLAPNLLDTLLTLAKQTKMSIEYVLHLAMEDYLVKDLNNSQSTSNKDCHEPTRCVQHAAEERDHT